MSMNLQEEMYLLKELEALILRLDIHVRYEHLTDAKSGLCKFKGTTYLIIDADAALDDRLRVLKGILSDLDLSKIYLPPAVREFLFGQ